MLDTLIRLLLVLAIVVIVIVIALVRRKQSRAGKQPVSLAVSFGLGLAAFFGFSVFLGAIFTVFDIKEGPASQQSIAKSADPDQGKSNTQDQLASLEKFEKAMLDMSAKLLEQDLAFDEALAQGAHDKLITYQNTERFKEFISGARGELQNIVVPTGFPDGVHDKLEQAKSEMMDGISTKATALDALFDYLDGNKVSQLDKYTQYAPGIKFKSKSAMEKIVEAKNLLK